MAELTIGAWVFSSDGRELGRVKKLEASAFLVDAPLAFDYWLERTLVKTISEERIWLKIAREQVAGYRMDRPHDHNGFQEQTSGIESAALRDSKLLP